MAVRQPNTTLETVSDYITDARTLMQDTIAPFRYDDTSLLTGLNISLLEGFRLRPDLFLFNPPVGGRIVPTFTKNDGTTVLIEFQFRNAFLHGMAGHALERDQEDVQDERAVLFLSIMTNLLTGKTILVKQGAQ